MASVFLDFGSHNFDPCCAIFSKVILLVSVEIKLLVRAISLDLFNNYGWHNLFQLDTSRKCFPPKITWEKIVHVMGLHDSQCSVNVNFAWQVCLRIHCMRLNQVCLCAACTGGNSSSCEL